MENVYGGKGKGRREENGGFLSLEVFVSHLALFAW
jgi:hypothetical protein